MSSWDAEMTKLGAEGAIDILCRGLADAVAAAPRLPSRASVRFGCASIEVEWPDAPDERLDVEPPAADAPATGTGNRFVVRSELVGTFYRAPEPAAKAFVEVGDFVEAGQQVGIVEAMKLMNPVCAGAAGRVVEILAGDAESVEYDQPLMVLEPGEQD
ncbi:acetyl-CoA carboxylase biotin carboxyl carrier protein subunit [Amycolatopsis sp. KNN50.9b]|nr:acetyl-CoA carboxylase biotin carboxyl carrier protein subunit [Amycolatopsis sp. KNN50.9b]